jgi:hypothetical protein
MLVVFILGGAWQFQAWWPLLALVKAFGWRLPAAQLPAAQAK